MAYLINGNEIAEKIFSEISIEILKKTSQGIKRPYLVSIMVGESCPSYIFVDSIEKSCKKVGIKFTKIHFDNAISEQELIRHIHEFNVNPDINGIIVLLPLPSHIHSQHVFESISPNKDVDCVHSYNLGRLLQHIPIFYPCASHGVMLLLDFIGQPLKGLHAVIVGSSNIGKVMATELIMADCTVTICNIYTPNLASYVGQADILILAAGKAELIKGSWIKPGATVIDIGVSCLPNGEIKGDVEFEAAREKAAYITSSVGGVGPMTVAMLLNNTLMAAGQ